MVPSALVVKFHIFVVLNLRLKLPVNCRYNGQVIAVGYSAL